MNREDILAKARQENDGTDYYALEVSSQGDTIVWIIALIILGVMVLASIVLKIFNIEDFLHLDEPTIVIVSALLCKYFYCYSKTKNKTKLKIGILCAVVLFLDVITILLRIIRIHLG